MTTATSGTLHYLRGGENLFLWEENFYADAVPNAVGLCGGALF